MQLHIEVTLTDPDPAFPARREAAVRRVLEIAELRDVDIERALRDGILCGVISSERVLELAVLDVVADFHLAAR